MNKMASRYGLECPIARCLDIVGERWTMLIVRDLLRQGPRRFHDLGRSLCGISPNTLSLRLKRLEANGIIERCLYMQHPIRAEYVLTAKGHRLEPILRALSDWGCKHTPSVCKDR